MMKVGTVYIFIILLVLIGVVFYVGASSDIITLARTIINASYALIGNTPSPNVAGVGNYYTGA